MVWVPEIRNRIGKEMKMQILDTIFSAIESSYRKTENLLLAGQEKTVDKEALVEQCMEQFSTVYMNGNSLIGLEAYFRFLVSGETSLRDIPFNFLLQEDDRSQRILEAFYCALSLITGTETTVHEITEDDLLENYERKLEDLGDCQVYLIRSSRSEPMTAAEYTAWNVVAEMFDRTPRIVKILVAPQEVIQTRFRQVDHIYYRVFRNMLRTRPVEPADMLSELLKTLAQRGFSWDNVFEEDMRAYVETVYPKADLREDRFVTDMVNRVVHLYYQKNRESMRLDSGCVPTYDKDIPAEAEPAPDAGTLETVSEQSATDESETPVEQEAASEPEAPAEAETASEAETPSAGEKVSETEDRKEEAPPEKDDLVDDYAKADKPPVVKNLLIVSLSTFPKNDMGKCVFRHGEDYGEYFYQQEPFPMHLREKLSDGGEILMLATPQTREQVQKKAGQEEFTDSPQGYFIKRVRNIPGLEGVLFKSISMDLEDPISTVSEVVEHLRTVKQNNGIEDMVLHLGTNGGLRGNQLILEAILSLLAADKIEVKPEDVWGLQGFGTQYELYNSAAEFKIFDFVAGINEFLNYGRIDSLNHFIVNNPDINDEITKVFMSCLDQISRGIQYCSIETFENGLDRLYTFYQQKAGDSSSNPYIQMFLNTIYEDYGPLLTDSCEVLDEIEWCQKKGFYQQAFTLCEAGLPKEFLRKGMICIEKSVLEEAKNLKFEDEESVTFIFNTVIVPFINENNSPKGQTLKAPPSRNNRAKQGSKVLVKYGEGQLSNELHNVLKSHIPVKNIRNELNHAISNCNGRLIVEITEKQDRSPEYRKKLANYTKALGKLYEDWKRVPENQTGPLRVSMFKDKIKQ